MDQIVIQTLDDPTIHRLKQLAWQHGCLVEEMARLLLIEAVRMRAPSQPPVQISVRAANFEGRELVV